MKDMGKQQTKQKLNTDLSRIMTRRGYRLNTGEVHDKQAELERNKEGEG